MSTAITIVCPSRRPHMMGRILSNYARQIGIECKLVICLHAIDVDPIHVKQAQEVGNVTFLHFGAEYSLGEMLNRAGIEVSTPYVCKWDDDDFYGSYFLAESVAALDRRQGRIVGKGGWYAWMEKLGKLYLRYDHCCNRRSGHLAGGTLSCATRDWLEIGFPNVNLGEDQIFIKRFLHLGYISWSTSRYNYVQCRNYQTGNHAWSVTDEAYLEGAVFVTNGLSFAEFEREFHL